MESLLRDESELAGWCVICRLFSWPASFLMELKIYGIYILTHCVSKGHCVQSDVVCRLSLGVYWLCGSVKFSREDMFDDPRGWKLRD